MGFIDTDTFFTSLICLLYVPIVNKYCHKLHDSRPTDSSLLAYLDGWGGFLRICILSSIISQHLARSHYILVLAIQYDQYNTFGAACPLEGHPINHYSITFPELSTCLNCVIRHASPPNIVAGRSYCSFETSSLEPRHDTLQAYTHWPPTIHAQFSTNPRTLFEPQFAVSSSPTPVKVRKDTLTGESTTRCSGFRSGNCIALSVKV
jgi:hypothetical protein